MLIFLKSKDGQPNDFQGINAFLARPIPGWGQIPAMHHGAANRWFCSEHVAAGFRAGGLLHGLEADEVPPQKLCECSICSKVRPAHQQAGRDSELQHALRRAVARLRQG
jgi:hypothetical protein